MGIVMRTFLLKDSSSDHCVVDRQVLLELCSHRENRLRQYTAGRTAWPGCGLGAGGVDKENSKMTAGLMACRTLRGHFSFLEEREGWENRVCLGENLGKMK